MLSEISITNFAIIDKLNLRFSPGFNVLTGETGAGKSIIIDAVSLLLGGRADTSQIRSGTEEARIEGIFLLNDEMQGVILPLLKENELEGDSEDVLFLAREIRRSGRSICRVNGRAVTLTIFEKIGQHLIDIHGQTEHLSLLRVREHIDFLDRYGGLWPLREEVASKVRTLREVRHKLAELLRDERELARRADLLRYQVAEIEAAKLRIGEEEELNAELRRLANAEQLIELTDEAYRSLHEGEEGRPSAIDLLGGVAQTLKTLGKIDQTLEEKRRAAEEISYQLEDLARSLRSYRDSIEYNPRRMREVEERLGLIYNLKRKYGDTVEEIIAFGEAAKRELDGIVHSEERVEELKAREEELLHEVGALAAELSARRREVGERLASTIEKELSELNMAGTRFGVEISQKEDEEGVWVGDKRYAFDERGIDRVEFLIAPNIGEPLKPLAKVASGGETSRIMLAMKTVLSLADRTPTLIFDEIDAGIGGRAGGVVGNKLWRLTPEHQVICVTHLPQLASYGDAHYKVSKRVIRGRTIASAQMLSEEERVGELAQMLGTETETTLQSAREMLEKVRKAKYEREVQIPG
jgi:DNA repair protein RecN (Recombination protein N)